MLGPDAANRQSVLSASASCIQSKALPTQSCPLYLSQVLHCPPRPRTVPQLCRQKEASGHLHVPLMERPWVCQSLTCSRLLVKVGAAALGGLLSTEPWAGDLQHK